jgi:2-polyprenyl-3-methyl-5-hydroxy-6-metoxy-1,4-benzoquinol methylase
MPTRIDDPMKEAVAESAVGYFSDNVEQFRALYGTSQGFHERVEIWSRLLRRYSRPGGAAIDMGCGPGVFSFFLADLGVTVVGIDGAPDMVQACEAQRAKRGLTNVRFIQGTLPHIDETTLEHADVLISSSVIEYIEELDETLALFARLMRSDGTLIVSMPNVHSLSRSYQRLSNWLSPRSDVYRYIRHFSSPRRLERRLAPHGLRLREAQYYTHITRLARAMRTLRLPRRLTEDLFVGVFEKTARN